MSLLEEMMKEKDIILPEANDFIRLHNDLIEVSGGRSGNIDQDRISSILHSMIYIEDLDLHTASAYLLSRVAKGHMFNDGNKRTAYFGTRYFLMLNGADFNGKLYHEASSQMNQIAAGKNIEEADRIARELVNKDLVLEEFKIKSYNTFYRLVIKSIGVANVLSKG